MPTHFGSLRVKRNRLINFLMEILFPISTLPELMHSDCLKLSSLMFWIGLAYYCCATFSKFKNEWLSSLKLDHYINKTF